METNSGEFNFKDLLVWQKAVEFGIKIIQLIDSLKTDRKHYRLIENLEAASQSISDNIAEGKGRFSDKEFRQYLFISRGSLYEVVSKLNFFYKLNWIAQDC